MYWKLVWRWMGFSGAIVGAAIAAITLLHLPGRDSVRHAYRILMGIETLDGIYEIAVLGDSNARRGRWHRLLPEIRVGNFGVGGETISEVARRVDQVVASRARTAFILVGVNDLIRGHDPEDAARDLVEILEPLRRHGVGVYFNSLVCGIASKARNSGMPVTSCADVLAFNLVARKVTVANGASFIDLTDNLMTGAELRPEFTDDGLHLNEAGYRVVAKIWMSRLKEGH